MPVTEPSSSMKTVFAIPLSKTGAPTGVRSQISSASSKLRAATEFVGRKDQGLW